VKNLPKVYSSREHGVLVFLGVLFTIILAGLDNTIVSTVMPVALPELGGAHLYAWTFAAYMLAAAVSMPIWGPGSDRWGRRRTYLIGILAFTLGSGLCAIARTMMEFIGARGIQGIGAGAVATLPFVLLGVVYPPNKRGRALGAASSAWAVASVAGPLLGTLIVTHLSWRWAFLINVPIAIIAGFLVIAGMHESIGHSVGRFDYAGALLAGAGGSCLMWAFVDLGEGQIGMMEAALIAAGIILLGVFVWHEGRTPHPILPLTFFHHAGYASSICSSFLAFFSGFGLSGYLPLATSAAFHDNRAYVGLVVGAFTIGWSTFAFVAGRLVHRIGERLPSVTGILVHILGLLLLMVAFEHGLGSVLVAALISGAGMGLISPALTVVVQNSVPVARMGSATTSQQFIRTIAAALGVSAFVLAATLGGFRVGLLLMVAVSAGTFACVLALPAHSLHHPDHVEALTD
jgi:EmrB/QacA subfamily drug resistance transporter